MRISDWSSDVCSSDLAALHELRHDQDALGGLDELRELEEFLVGHQAVDGQAGLGDQGLRFGLRPCGGARHAENDSDGRQRSEEHTSELQSLMRISYAVFCLKKKKHKHENMRTCNQTDKHNIQTTM